MSSTDPERPHQHDFDAATNYCKRCGISLSQATNLGKACAPPDGTVTGISHIISQRRIARLTKVLTSGK